MLISFYHNLCVSFCEKQLVWSNTFYASLAGTPCYQDVCPLPVNARSIRLILVSRNHTNNTVAVKKLKNTLIASELSSPNFNSSVRAEQSFAIPYPNVVIKLLCGNIDICLNYHANAYF